MTKGPVASKELRGPVHEDAPDAVGGGDLKRPAPSLHFSLANSARRATATQRKTGQPQALTKDDGRAGAGGPATRFGAARRELES